MKAFAEEETYEQNAARLRDQFIHKMTQARNSDNEEAKKVLEREAIAALQMMMHESNSAAKYRKLVEDGRMEFLALDCKLTDLTEEFADKVCEVAIQAVNKAFPISLPVTKSGSGRMKDTKEARTKKDGSSKVVDGALKDVRSRKNNQAKDEMKLHGPPQQTTKLPAADTTKPKPNIRIAALTKKETADMECIPKEDNTRRISTIKIVTPPITPSSHSGESTTNDAHVEDQTDLKANDQGPKHRKKLAKSKSKSKKTNVGSNGM